MAGFTINCAADLFGTKHNLELHFPHGRPSIPELEAHIASTFQIEAEMQPHRPPGAVPRFDISRLSIYDDAAAKWVDCTSGAQLKERAQLYAFQREPPAPTPYAAAAPAAAASAYAPAPAPPAPAAAYPAPPAASPHAVHYSAPAPVSVVPAAPQAAAHVVDNASHEEKARAVFEDLDLNKNQVLENEEFSRAFRVFNFDLSSATVADLFAKADADRNGVIDFGEWQRFAEQYPTLLDSLYFRSRDHWEDVRQKNEIAAARNDLEARREAEKQAHHAHLMAQQSTNVQEKRVAAAEQELAEAVEKEREAKTRLLDGQRDTEGALRERAQRAQDLDLAKERERQRAIAHAESQRDTDMAENALRCQEHEQMRAQDSERQSAEVLVEAQRATERTRRVEGECKADMAAARDREQHAQLAHLEERRQTEIATDRLNQADLELQQRTVRERDMDGRCREAAGVTEHEGIRRDEEEHGLSVARSHEQAAHAGHLESQRAVEDQDKQVLALDAERTAFLQRRKQVEDQEKPLLEQEVRLREARDSLEEKEAKLRSDAHVFHGSARAALHYGVQPAGSPYRLPRQL
eukprot:TRINITY_DN70258_c0_g1_i1.p1 TRINITY_DN70258_c0_g1~~TRINITY_DN70258_c0_g1_i1.p1  ORF type:complete len:611 (+),score=271.11 TRINITY_DN70258_c0_g1_i1:97-1833(+)